MLKLLVTLLFLAVIYWLATQYYGSSPKQQDIDPQSIPHNIESQINDVLNLGQQRLKEAEKRIE